MKKLSYLTVLVMILALIAGCTDSPTVPEGTPVDATKPLLQNFNNGCIEPPNGLISWWPGDGNANDIEDGNDGTLVNGAASAPGKVGQAFSLDGIDDHISVNSNSNLNPSSFTYDFLAF